MSLVRLLAEREDGILARWRTQIYDRYPAETSRFLQREKDGFANPVGAAILRTTAEMLTAIKAERPPRELAEPIEALVRIRSLQSMSPGETVSFVYLLRLSLEAEIGELLTLGDRRKLDRYLDELTLVSFDVYVACRDQVWEIRSAEARRAAFSLIERAERQSAAKAEEDETPRPEREE
jgi:hypothetical protein